MDGTRLRRSVAANVRPPLGQLKQAVPVDVTVLHTAPSASIRVTTTLDKTAYDESWGIRGFKL
ncbi:hypothetical protein EMIHUDRAFT_197900 [Emiliania huxleyi CCMP1516]|uniref:Uncharacterized protein n=2 Tax=Emiliania huxleyi TaxID=2903 RepID=A0A0D3IDX6_EMIH1|nr:hypothetical protein EMIHUDRAFT_197900 [Emiliania huxleyi CCMP1516]EOD09461.1 hypothetical protein EMIHUDRAFT_197900 [Emiliania huxleyi CCMP1516]|eukprot:XP_005761890.1 hypothetical protein EMIHUDRAFT_197900 [Emiliania huxleyi CCMP1516]